MLHKTERYIGQRKSHRKSKKKDRQADIRKNSQAKMDRGTHRQTDWDTDRLNKRQAPAPALWLIVRCQFSHRGLNGRQQAGFLLLTSPTCQPRFISTLKMDTLPMGRWGGDCNTGGCWGAGTMCFQGVARRYRISDPFQWFDQMQTFYSI